MPLDKKKQVEQSPKPRLREINRNQIQLRPTDVEKLIPADHMARAIWELMGELDLSGFYQDIEAVEGKAGSPAYDPRLLCSMWLYAYSEGINLAREISRLCEYHPGFQWLTGMEVINYHSLSDCRKNHKEALDRLFSQVLAAMSVEGLVDLKRVMHDGTKIKASASGKSFRREKRVKAHLKMAQEYVSKLSEPLIGEEKTPQEEAGQKRAAAKKQERLEKALQELEKIQETKSGNEARVSENDPESRIMKQGNGGYAPSYNVQISTDAKAGIIVGVGVSQSASDYEELPEAIKRIEENLEKKPEQVVTDGGFTSGENIVEMSERGIDFIGSLKDPEAQKAKDLKRRGVTPEFAPTKFIYSSQENSYTCPGGKQLSYVGQRKTTGKTIFTYRARAKDCRACRFKSCCCPKAVSGRSLVRSEDDPVVAAFKEKMQTESAKAICRQRGGIAEFPNAWIKAKIGLRQFCLRGLAKVSTEALWACLTYNIQQWLRYRREKAVCCAVGTA